MSNINKELEKILSARYGKDVRQAIHDSIKEIDAVADTAQDSATKMAAMAGNHEASAKAYMESALASAESARASAEQAMSGTPDGYEALVEQVALLDIATSTGNTLYNSKKGVYRLNDLVGNTEQKTMSGKNLLNNTLESQTKNGITVTVNADKSVTLKGTSTGTGNTFLTLETNAAKNTVDGEEYILSCHSTASDMGAYIRIDGSDGLSMVTTNTEVKYTETERKSVHIVFGAGKTVDCTLYPMIRKADEADPTYEPYCGGTPSSNPLFPQAIENTFDGVEMINGYYVNGVYTLGSGISVCSKRHIPCASGDILKLEVETANKMVFVYYKDGVYVGRSTAMDDYGYLFSDTVPSGVDSFTFHLSNARQITPQTVGKITLTVNGKYVGQIVTELGADLIQGTYGTTKGEYQTSTSACCTKNLIPCTSGDVVSILTENTLTTRLYMYDENKNFIQSVVSSATNKYTITIPSSVKVSYIAFRLSYTDNRKITPETVGKVTFTINGVGEKVTTFFLNEQLRATDRIVRKDGVIYENHKRTTVVFDGSDDEVIEYTTSSIASGGYFTVELPKLSTYSTGIVPNILCTHLRPIRNNVAAFVDGTITIGNSKNKIVVTLNEVTNVPTARAWLQANPITVEYELLEETLTPLDTESQLALNSLETFDTVTYIEVDSKVKPTSISGEYGTSKVGAYTLKCMNDNDTDRVERAEMKARLDELAVALVSQ